MFRAQTDWARETSGAPPSGFGGVVMLRILYPLANLG